ncbi:tannase and feruloyl esterase-domain-containing protein [Ilyonectria robusta]|uniref:tannase and feruloyl esterase-domain-containing protein n=1 Tax=Ilyonectria robusta TaxID=1079257 RepID=UPI001E8EB8D4|nr:tannase and feruloyl esterase-domain-containing protein [Ilyonectria robusta]KAH8661826.1 tannase and feruloyl esterase-domain-containing protein [Ilyonectria robusta]
MAVYVFFQAHGLNVSVRPVLDDKRALEKSAAYDPFHGSANGSGQRENAKFRPYSRLGRLGQVRVFDYYSRDENMLEILNSCKDDVVGIKWLSMPSPDVMEQGFIFMTAAKRMMELFYDASIQYAYYSGCSTGGRQGLKDARLFRDDFDGMLIGAPPWWTALLQTWTTQLGIHNLPVGAANHVDASLYPVPAAEAVAQCDVVDGVVDGIISRPKLGDFNPDTLLSMGPSTGDPHVLLSEPRAFVT